MPLDIRLMTVISVDNYCGYALYIFISSISGEIGDGLLKVGAPQSEIYAASLPIHGYFMPIGRKK